MVPIVVDLDAQETPLSAEDVETAWSARRATTPNCGDGASAVRTNTETDTEARKEPLELFIATSYDLDVSVWTTPTQPSGISLRRMQLFAKASAAKVCA